MNRIILVLNVIVLVVTFVLALSAQDSQIGLLQSSARATSRVAVPTQGEGTLAYFRVVQSLDSLAPPQIKEHLTSTRLRAIHVAVNDYYGSIRRSVDRLLYAGGDAKVMQRAFGEASRDAREIVEQTLARTFADRAFVKRLTTEILRQCR